MAKIYIYIGAHLCTAPRPQKEALFLAKAGHDVTVCGIWFDPTLVARDQELVSQQPYEFKPILDFRDEPQNKFTRLGVRLQARIAREAYRRFKYFSPALLGYGAKAMVRTAKQAKADFNIFHSEAGLWAGHQLLKQGYPVGFDFEDWFSEDLPESARVTRPLKKIKELESSLLKQCDYRLTTSAGMARLSKVAERSWPSTA